MTPIQELKAKLLKRFKHVNNYELYSTIDDHIDNEKEFAKKCFDAGRHNGIDAIVSIHAVDDQIAPDFEQFYKQIIK